MLRRTHAPFYLSLVAASLILGSAGSAQAEDVACFGTRSYGMSCLTESGWKQFNRENGALRSDTVSDLISCPDGKMYAGSFRNVLIYDGGRWSEFARLNTGSVSKMACAPGGGLWIAHHRAVTQIGGPQQTTFQTGDFMPDGKPASIKGIAADRKGGVWLSLFGGKVAHYNGQAWRVFSQGQGFQGRYIFTAMALDADGRPIVGETRSLMRFIDGAWMPTPKPFGSTNAITLDAQGRIWFSVSGKGVFMIDGQRQVSWSAKSGGPASDSIQAMAFDSTGRLWVGTSFGISVKAGDTWTSYQMHNSDLADNTVSSIAVLGKGGALPKPVDKPKGSFVGKVEWNDGDPIAGKAIEVCASTGLVFFLRSRSPCAGRKLHFKGVTGDNGSFSFQGLPSARYRLAVETSEGWKSVFLGRRGRLLAGENRRLGTLPIRRRRK